MTGDLTKEEDVNKIVDAVLQKFGTLHVLVSTGGWLEHDVGPRDIVHRALLLWKDKPVGNKRNRRLADLRPPQESFCVRAQQIRNGVTM